jgi:hypothetical protein
MQGMRGAARSSRHRPCRNARMAVALTISMVCGEGLSDMVILGWGILVD